MNCDIINTIDEPQIYASIYETQENANESLLIESRSVVGDRKVGRDES